MLDIGVTGVQEVIYRTLVDTLEQQDLDLALVQRRLGHSRINPFRGGAAYQSYSVCLFASRGARRVPDGKGAGNRREADGDSRRGRNRGTILAQPPGAPDENAAPPA
ncbi:hypothetical protein GCM10008997_05580 [Halomonas salifodinae]